MQLAGYEEDQPGNGRMLADGGSSVVSWFSCSRSGGATAREGEGRGRGGIHKIVITNGRNLYYDEI